MISAYKKVLKKLEKLKTKIMKLFYKKTSESYIQENGIDVKSETYALINSGETRRKLREANTGKILTENHKSKISDALKELGI
jgi:hypothetical protein